MSCNSIISSHTVLRLLCFTFLLAGFVGVARQRPSISNVRVSYFGSTGQAGFCVSSSEKLINFMHFHNSCTQNFDHHILLIMTGNAHKESCHKLLLILVREQGLYIIKTVCSGKMVVAFTIKEKLFNGKPILPIGAPLSYLYLWY